MEDQMREICLQRFGSSKLQRRTKVHDLEKWKVGHLRRLEEGKVG